MTMYWPCASVATADGTQQISTYDSCINLAQARQQIALWRDWYKYDIQNAWVTVYERGKKLNTIQIDPKTDEIITNKGGKRNG